jgi:hypothetical protein
VSRRGSAIKKRNQETQSRNAIKKCDQEVRSHRISPSNLQDKDCRTKIAGQRSKVQGLGHFLRRDIGGSNLRDDLITNLGMGRLVAAELNGLNQ